MLERWLDPYSVLSASSTDPVLLEPRPAPVSPSSAAAPPASSSAHFSLDVGELDDVELHPSSHADDSHIEQEGNSQAQPVDPVDAAMARIVPAPVAALLRSPRVSGEMAFAAEAAQRQRRTPADRHGEKRVLV